VRAEDELALLSPLDGWAAGLEETGDPVFAERMLGDGVAVDPTTGVLRAPAAATVTSVHAARHAVSLRTAAGPEILLHIGLETVALRGEGFETHVAAGQAVAAGDPLITFDLDRVAQGAASLISPLVITEGAGFEIIERRGDGLVAAGDVLLRLRKVQPAKAAAATGEATGPQARRSVVVPLAHGLHARPAARVAALAGGYRARIEISTADRTADARSPVGLMTLGLGRGDAALIHATGPDAQIAVADIAELIERGLGEISHKVATTPSVDERPELPPDGRLRGVAAAPGLAIGAAARLTSGDIAVAEAGGGIAEERRALGAALDSVAARLAESQARETDPTRQGILAAHAGFLTDPALAGEAERLIAAGKSAGFAWKSAVGGFIDELGRLADSRLAERVDDLRDLERRVLTALAGDDAPEADIPSGAILLADELLPSQLMAIPAGRLAGIATAGGGPTSHVAIIAAAMNVPALVAVGAGLSSVQAGTPLIVDADAGLLEVAPNAKALAAAQARLAERRARHEAAAAAASAPAKTLDGALVAVLANLGGDGAEAQGAIAAGAEGCGLLRTEFMFLDRDAAPSEDEQTVRYQAIADALGGRPLVARLLDTGADKPARFLPAAAEENPALGVRGVRLALRRPELLDAQLRALLRVRSGGLAIMIPMVSRLDELRAVRAALDRAAAELGVTAPELGVMVETAAAAMIADQLAAEAAFLSLGTNDLTQYALAMDRGHPALAGELDALEPAVLRLIAAACQGAAKHARPVSVCGALAGDPAAIPILIGLGVSRLSMPASSIAEAKALIRRLSTDDCRTLAEAALGLTSAADVRARALHARGAA
jgi:phosphocarrier protein FPr/phosphocarrier protein